LVLFECLEFLYKTHNLFRFKQYLTVDLKTRLFKQLILPHFLYASTVYSGTLLAANLKTLSRALRTAVRFVYDRGRRDSISSFVVKLLSLPFDKFLKERRLLLLFKALRFHHYPRYLKLSLERGTSLRSSLLKPPKLTSSWSHRCPIRVSITDWNKLEAASRQCSNISGFKRLIHSRLLQ
jgi:hypothetical protein